MEKQKESDLEWLKVECQNVRRKGRKGRYSSEFREKILDLIESGVKIKPLCKEIGLTPVNVERWLKTDRPVSGVKVLPVRDYRSTTLSTDQCILSLKTPQFEVQIFCAGGKGS